MTLIEVVIGLSLFTAFSASAFLALETSSRSYRTETVVTRLDSQAHEALDEVCGRLEEADFASITPPAVLAPASASTIDFQRARGFAGGAVQWGPTERLAYETDPGDPANGVDDDGEA
jgi:hypothetical protein